MKIYYFFEFKIIKSKLLIMFLRFLKTKYIFYRLKNLKRYKIFFINLNNIFFVLFIFIVVKSNEQLKLFVDYRKFNIITRLNIYLIFDRKNINSSY